MHLSNLSKQQQIEVHGFASKLPSALTREQKAELIGLYAQKVYQVGIYKDFVDHMKEMLQINQQMQKLYQSTAKKVIGGLINKGNSCN